MYLYKETPGCIVYLEVDGSDTPDVMKAKINGMGYKPKKWYLNLEPMIKPMEGGSSQILVRTPTRKIIGFRLKSYYTISRLKSDIHSVEGIFPYAQTLFFAGKWLENSYTLSHYNISPGSILDLLLLSGRGQLMVETTSGKRLSLEVRSSFTIKQVKGLIEDQIGMSIGQQKLVNVDAGEELIDTNVLGFYRINNEAILRLVDDALMTSRIEMMQVNVKIVAAGKTIRLNVARSNTIIDVKNMIQESESIPIGEQVLYLPQKRLEDDTFTLAQYYILNETTLHLVQIPENHECKEDIPQDQLSNYKESIPSKRQRLSA